MSLTETETDRARRLAGALFDEMVAPLTMARSEGGRADYFPTVGDGSGSSYFDEPLVAEMSPADFEFAGATPEDLLDAMSAYWLAQGEAELAEMIPRMKEIAASLREAALADDGSVSILCYTMF